MISSELTEGDSARGSFDRFPGLGFAILTVWDDSGWNRSVLYDQGRELDRFSRMGARVWLKVSAIKDKLSETLQKLFA